LASIEKVGVTRVNAISICSRTGRSEN